MLGTAVGKRKSRKRGANATVSIVVDGNLANDSTNKCQRSARKVTGKNNQQQLSNSSETGSNASTISGCDDSDGLRID